MSTSFNFVTVKSQFKAGRYQGDMESCEERRVSRSRDKVLGAVRQSRVSKNLQVFRRAVAVVLCCSWSSTRLKDQEQTSDLGHIFHPVENSPWFISPPLSSISTSQDLLFYPWAPQGLSKPAELPVVPVRFSSAPPASVPSALSPLGAARGKRRNRNELGSLQMPFNSSRSRENWREMVSFSLLLEEKSQT